MNTIWKILKVLIGVGVVGLLGLLIFGAIVFLGKDSDDGAYVPLSNDGLITIIDGYGNQGSFGDAIHGRKIVVRDDLPLNENGYATREIYEVSSLSDLGIDAAFAATFPIEYERDFSATSDAFVSYFSMNIDTQVPLDQIQAFLDAHPEVIATTVVNLLDSAGNKQECTLEGLISSGVRYVLYSGDNVSFQVCNPDWLH